MERVGKGGMKQWLMLLALPFFLAEARAVITVQDDNGDIVTLQRPARRIVTLSPHITELVFAAGGGGRIVGTVKHSDYPAAAASIPRVGDNRMVDIERLIAVKPDLLLVWRHNGAQRQLEPLRKLGIPVFYSEPRTLEDVPDNMLRLARLLGTEPQAEQLAADMRRQLANLAAQYRDRPPVRVFYQLWDKPLYTLNGRHIVSDAIRLCGGVNIFAALPLPAPVVSIEAVLLEKPDAIVAGERHGSTDSGLEQWRQYPGMPAVRRGNLFAIDGDLLNRPGPRSIAGAAALCEKLEQARHDKENRP